MVDEVEAWRARQLEAIDDAVRASDQARRLLALAARLVESAADARREVVVLRRELAARQGRPDAAAPVYEGHSWTSEHGWWSGPFHLVAVERVAYPGAAEGGAPGDRGASEAGVVRGAVPWIRWRVACCGGCVPGLRVPSPAISRSVTDASGWVSPIPGLRPATPLDAPTQRAKRW